MSFGSKLPLILLAIASASSVPAAHRLRLEMQRLEWQEHHVYVELNDDLWAGYRPDVVLLFDKSEKLSDVRAKTDLWKERLAQFGIIRLHAGILSPARVESVLNGEIYPKP